MVEVMKIKQIFAATSLILAMACSQQNIVVPVDFEVSLDPENIYRPGYPIHFKFSGDADYMVFYSGEVGHEFRYRDRTSVPTEEVNSVKMNIEYTMLWGSQKKGLDVYISNTNDRILFGADGEADRAAIRKMIEGGLKGWTDLEYSKIEGEHDIPVKAEYDLDDYMDKFSLAFHWHPNTYKFTRNQGTYHINGDIMMKFGGNNSMTTRLNDVPFDLIVMNEQDPPYLGKNPLKRGDTVSIATAHFDDSRYAINFEGTNPTFLDYELDVWCISQPMPLNTVLKDTGVQIKNMMNPIYDYEYSYDKPGTYKAVFYGVNDNYQGHTTAVREVTVVIADEPVFDK